MFVLCAQVGSENVPACVRGYAVVTLLGAWGFFTHFISPCAQYRTILGPQWCQVLLLWWYVQCKFCVSGCIVCTSGIVGSKNVPACVRGYAVRRPGIFNSFYVQSLTILNPEWCQVLLCCVHRGGIVGSKNVPACVRGYAVGRPGDFLHISFHLLCHIVWFWVNNSGQFCQFGDTNGVSFV